MPYSPWDLILDIELSHFTLSIDSRNIIVRYNCHTSDSVSDMIKYKTLEVRNEDYLFAAEVGQVRHRTEEKEYGNEKLYYYPVYQFVIPLY